MSYAALVIGSRGFVGRGLVAALVEQGASVQGVSRSPAADDVVPTCRPDQLESLAPAFDCVYLLAAVIPYGEMDRLSAEMIASNVELPLRVARQFPAARLVFASSVAVYGQPLDLPIDEEHPFHRPNAYGLSKALTERAVLAHENGVAIRFSSIYGPGMTAPTFLPKLIESGRRERRLAVYGDGSRLQDYLHVEDAVRMLLAAAGSDRTGVFNGVHGSSVSNRDVAQLVSRQLGDVPIQLAGDDPSPSFVYSRRKWDDAFDCPPQIALCDGIIRMMDATV